MVNGLVYTARSREHALDTPSSSDQRTENETRSDLSSPPSVAASGSGGPLLPTTIGDHSYVGATHWASILESIHDIQGILRTEMDEPPTPSPPPQTDSADEPDILFGKQGGVSTLLVLTGSCFLSD